VAESFDFDELERLRNGLIRLRSTHVETLKAYVSGDNLGFKHQIKQKKIKASLASTATCVSSLVATNGWTKEFPLYNRTAQLAAHLLKQNTSADLPENNAFSLSFVAEGVLDLMRAVPEYPGHEQHVLRIRRRIIPRLRNKILDGDSGVGAVAIPPYPASAYLTQLTHRVIRRLRGYDETLDGVVHAWSRDEINKQVALLTAESRVGDPMQLAYALILAVSTLPDESTKPEDKEIFAHALSLFFGCQDKDGSWPLSRPMFHYKKVGNAYCFEYELLTQLLLCKPLQLDLLPYLSNFQQSVRLLQKTKFDLDSTADVKQVAWASGHHPQIPGPESWSTASVYHFAYALDRLLAEAIRRELFRELKVAYKGPPGNSTLPPANGSIKDFAVDFLDAKLDAPQSEGGSLKATLARRFVYPLAKEAANVGMGGNFDPDTPMSAILFGPPGTSKTELAKVVRDYLNWPLLEVDPSYLVQQGLDRVQAMANKLFSMLLMAEQVVILLDEFDEMGRTREANQDILSRFITTAMLPKLAAINKERKIVFLLATNYVSGFDAAFARSGRFDMRIQVMPPTYKAKLAKWPVLGGFLAAASTTLPNAASKIGDLTFLETKELVKAWESAPSSDAGALLSDAWHACTLQKPLKRPSEQAAPTTEQALAQLTEAQLPGAGARNWAESAEQDREFILIPSPPSR
jgi:hypothetical protein